MKHLINALLIMTIILAFAACKKDPKDAVLTADKTSVTKGGTIGFSCQWDGSGEWFNWHIKKPKESTFSDSEMGGVSNTYSITADSVGVYTVYVIVYACKNKGDYNKLKECNGQTKSNEVSITVTP